MANEPLSPISDLAQRLAQQPALKKAGVPVFPWRQSQAKTTAARRIVLYPHKGGALAASSVPEGLVDIEQTMVAECWGDNGDQTYAMMVWLIQALQSQGEGTEGAPGYWWEFIGSDWEIAADTGARGQVVSVFFSVRFAIVATAFDPAKLGVWPTGVINAVTNTLTAP